MKLHKILAVTLFAVLFSAGTTFAQKGMTAPSSQFGIGVGTSGGEIVYALSPSLQIGSYLALGLGDGATNIGIAPYVRFLLEGVPVNPMFQVGFSLNSSTLNSVNTSTKGLFGDFGLVYYATKNVGIMGGVTIANISLETGGAKRFGVLSGFAGIDMFF